MITINTPQELFKHVAESDEPPDFNEIALGDGFRQKIVVEGSGWSGKIDYRAGQIIVNAQKDFLKIVSECTGQNYTLHSRLFKDSNLLVTAEIQDGSLQDIIDFADAIKEAVKNMDSKDLRNVFLAAIVAMFVGYGFGQYNEAKIETARIAKDQGMQALVERGFDVAEKANSVPRYIVSKMSEDDRIVVNEGAPLTKKEARAALPVSTQEEPEYSEKIHWVDDDFELQSWGLAKAIFGIMDSNNTVLNANLEMMIPDEKEKLKKALPTEIGLPAKIKIRLRVAVVLNNEKKPIGSYILQVEPKDEGYPTLSGLMTDGES